MSTRLRTILLLLALAAAVTGCVQSGSNEADTSEAEAASANMPEGAVDIGGGLWQVPVGTDESGLTQYRLQWADSGEPVGSAVYYRMPNGTFTTDKSVLQAQ